MTRPNKCEELVGNYLEQLAEDFDTSPLDSGCLIVTPFIRPDGEAIELEVELLPDGNVLISDMGDTLGYLYANGLTLSRTVLDNAKRISMRYGVSLQITDFKIEADPDSIGEAMHGLIQTALSVTDLIQRRRPTTRVNFEQEVESFVIVSGVVYDTDFSVRGRRSTHKVSFHVNSGRNLLIQPISAATEGSAFAWSERWAYRFNDIQERDDKWRFLAVLDDRGQRVQVWSERAIAPLEQHAVLWANKERLSEVLSIQKVR